MRFKRRGFFLVILSLIIAGCNLPASLDNEPHLPTASETQTPVDADFDSTKFTKGEAQVETIEITILESFPVQVNVVAHGSNPDSCTLIDNVLSELDGNTFTIQITTVRPKDLDCSEVIVPFVETIPLEVAGLPAGTYKVIVNEISDTFTLAVDNLLLTETAEPNGEGSIQGKIWHDECAIAGGTETQPEVISEGCVESNGNYHANGVYDSDEQDIAGVLVKLGVGTCPSTGLATVVTDPHGSFLFTDLPAGDYCISIDAEENENEPILIPGEWTAPASSHGRIQVSLAADETKTVSFGWDYELLPVLNAPGCTDQATFIDDITIPDDTELSPGASFDKTWRLENSGTCSWGEGYGLTFVEGDQMQGLDSFLLPDIVSPGQIVDLTIPLVAPSIEGSYRGDWKLNNPDGGIFGTGDNANESMWVQIIVIASTTKPTLGDPDHTESFSNGNAWYQGEDEHSRFEVKDGAMVMTALYPDNWDGWSISAPSLSDFYIEMSAKVEACNGLDRYGLVVRAPDLTHAYLVGFSCDGRFSLRKWDGESFTILKNWTSSGHILSGSNKTNTIGLWAKDEKLSIYGNDKLLAEIEDDSFPTGNYGLFVASANTSNFTVKVNEVSYWILP